jgi:H+/Cl- antiporter ClcA
MGVALATVARAPFTGILLTMETADAFPMLLPMTIAVVGGAVVTQGLRSPSLGHGLERLREHLDKLIF